MYVCICKGVTENQIRDAIRGGSCTRKEISRRLKVGTACGKCKREVGDLLRRSQPTENSRLISLLNEADPQTFKIPSPGGSPSPAEAARAKTARGILIMENAPSLPEGLG